MSKLTKNQKTIRRQFLEFNMGGKTLSKEVLNDLTNPEKNLKEFCVEIAEDNKEVLAKVYSDKFNVHPILTKEHIVKGFLTWREYATNNKYLGISRNKLGEIVSTEKFLKLIGREDLIETPEPKRNYKISEIVDKVVELSKEKLEFYLPKKEYTLEDIKNSFIAGRNSKPRLGIGLERGGLFPNKDHSLDDYLKPLKQ